MTNITRIAFGIIVSLSLLPGCGEGLDPSPKPTGTAFIQLVDDAHVVGSYNVEARAAETGKLVEQMKLATKGSAASTVTLKLPEGQYVIDTQAFATAEGTVFLGSKSTIADIKAGTETDTKLDLGLSSSGSSVVTLVSAGGINISGGGTTGGGTGGASGNVGGGVSLGGGITGSADGGVSTGGSVTGGADGGVNVGGGGLVAGSATINAPVISGADVKVGLTTTKIGVRATGSAGGDLTFTWSGAGLNAALQGGAMLDLSTKAILTASDKTIQVVVQSNDGTAVQVKTTLDAKPGPLGTLTLSGTTSTTVVTAGAQLSAQAKACWEAHASCTANCKASINASAGDSSAKADCMARCAMTLATCK